MVGEHFQRKRSILQMNMKIKDIKKLYVQQEQLLSDVVHY